MYRPSITNFIKGRGQLSSDNVKHMFMSMWTSVSIGIAITQTLSDIMILADYFLYTNKSHIHQYYTMAYSDTAYRDILSFTSRRAPLHFMV